MSARAILAAIIFAMPLTAKEVLHPVKLRPGEVVRSIPIRVTTGQPRFVVASRVVEEGESLSVPLEPPAEDRQSLPASCNAADRGYRPRFVLARRATESQIDNWLRRRHEPHCTRVGRSSRKALGYRDDLRDAKSAFDDVALVNVHLNEGVLRDGSMFLMVLVLLTPEQTEQLAQANFGKLTLPWPVELSDVQRSQLWRLVMATNDRHTEPPRLWGTQRLSIAGCPIAEFWNLPDSSMSLRSTLSNVGADADSNSILRGTLDAGITDACRAVDTNTRRDPLRRKFSTRSSCAARQF